MTTEQLDQYARDRIKSILTGTDGKKVFGEINNDKNLTPDEKQRICCAIGKAAVEIGCTKAMASDPNTLLRENTGLNTFISAYMAHHGQDYFTAVAQKSIEASTHTKRNEKGEVISRTPPDELETAKQMLGAYTTELPKLSKEASQFMKVCVDVIKDKMPQHSETAIPKVLSSNMVLRGASPKVTVGWSTKPENRDVQRRRTDIEEEMAKPSRAIDYAKSQIKEINKKLEGLAGSLEKTPLEQQGPLKEQIKKLEKEKLDHQTDIEKQEKLVGPAKLKGEQDLKEIEAPLNEYTAGSNAANAVMELANKPEARQGELNRGLANQLLGEQESVSKFQNTLKQIGDGAITQHVAIKDLPTVDIEKIGKEVEIEIAANKLAKDKEKIQPDMEKLGKLQKKLSDLETSRLERFKAWFGKGGVEGAKRRLGSEIEKTKLDIVSKVDTEQLGARMEINKDNLQKLQESQKQSLPGANAYLQAEKELQQIKGELVLNRLGGGMGGGIDEGLDQRQVEAAQRLEQVMNHNKADYETYTNLQKHIDRAQGVVEHGGRLMPDKPKVDDNHNKPTVGEMIGKPGTHKAEGNDIKQEGTKVGTTAKIEKTTERLSVKQPMNGTGQKLGGF